ncbi:MAG: biotin/lipoyl-containing protein, partial [Dehalococcoidia bacterium]
MSTPITMPQMGADMTEGTVIKWLKAVGDQVERGDILAEIETDKATVELEAFESGIMQKLVVDEGETVPVGETIAILGEAGEEIEQPERKPAAETPARRRVSEAEPASSEAPGEPTDEAAPAPAAATAPPLPPASAAVPEDGRVRISPVARRIAEDKGVDIASVAGTGPGGRVLRRDVEAAAAAPPAGAPAREPAPQPRPAARPAP